MPNIWKNGANTNANTFVLPSAEDIYLDDEFEQELINEQEESESQEQEQKEQDNKEDIKEDAPTKEQEQLVKPQKQSAVKKQHETPEITAARLRNEVQAVVQQVAQTTKQAPPAKKNAAAELSFATVQANEIIANAHKSAAILTEKLLEEAKKQIEEKTQAAQKEGYQSGYEAGVRLGEMKAQKDMQNQLAAHLKTYIQKETKIREELIDNTKSQLTDVTIAVAEKIMQISLKSSREVIIRMISVATEKLKRREWVRIYVAESDAGELVQGSPELRAALTGLSDNVKIVPMQDDEPGTCIIEMPDEIIDASVSSQLKTIRDLIQE